MSEKESIEFSILPKPVKIIKKSGEFILNDKTVVIALKEMEQIAKYFLNIVKPSTGFNLKITSIQEPQNFIHLSIDSNLTLEQEGYSLIVDPKGVSIKGVDANGVFYGIQTLRQLLPPEIESKTLVKNLDWKIPCVEIIDYPRFHWRGYMLDVCRHFFDIEEIKKLIEAIALQKFNIFHWHLTEDQGWRIEIKKYPKLTEIGAWRKDTQLRHTRSKGFEGKPHGGFYTQEQIKEVIQFAQERFIKIIPEIEIPGHSQAAIASYPDLTCDRGQYEVSTTFGIKKIVYCPGKDTTFQFWYDVLDEVMKIFPSDVIHTGGDEVPKDRWRSCPDCQERIKKEKLKDENDLQVYVTNNISKYLAEHGRRLMGWNEILDKDLEKNAICHYWAHSEEKVIEAIKQGHDTVISKNQFVYLDHTYKSRPLSRVYSLNPILEGLDPESQKHILGVEAPLWTEWVPTNERAEFMTFPRLCAVAEIGWMPQEQRDFNQFKQRLKSFEKRLDILNIRYAKDSEQDISIISKIKSIFKKT